MQWQRCCKKRVLVWRTRPAGKRFADQYVCANCDHIHRTETWYAPLAWSDPSDCLNCGAPRSDTGSCNRCRYSPARSAKLHEKLTNLHPANDPLVGADSAFEQGRSLLAIKLATVALYQDPSLIQAKLIRLRVMERIGFIAPALDQAWNWVDHGAPAQVWGVIANLEAAQGNVDGALFALERGVQAAPTSKELWIEYGELLAYKDNRPLAIQAASKAIANPYVRERALNIIGTMAQRYFEEGLVAEAIKGLHVAGDQQIDNVPIAWLRAQIAHTTHQPAECLRWLNIVLKLAPKHRDAHRLHQTHYGGKAAPRPQDASKTSKRKWWSRSA